MMARRLAIHAVVILVAFLAGFFPMWLSARTAATEREAAQQALGLARIENSLAAAAIQARRGDYDPARAAASTFYTDLQATLERADPALPAPSREALQALLGERDQMIALLARHDPAVAERLSQSYMSYREAVGSTAR